MRKTSFDGSVGENVQTLRKARDMSQAQLADLMTRASDSSIHQQTVLRIEKGERPLKLSEAIALAKIFGVPPTALWRVSEVDSLTGTWLQRVEDLEHRREVARALSYTSRNTSNTETRARCPIRLKKSPGPQTESATQPR